MAYSLMSVKCPECGKTLSIEPDRTQAFCTYCGAKVLISNDNEFVFRQVDEADVRKAETDRMVRMHEIEMQEKNQAIRKTLTVVWLVLTVLLIVIAVILAFTDDAEGTFFMFLIYACAPIIGGGAWMIFKWLPEREVQKTIARNGGIRFPKDLEPFSEKKVQPVMEALHVAGFTNVTCINEKDLNILTVLLSGDKVDRITVGGESIVSGGKYYRPDVPIVVHYHGM